MHLVVTSCTNRKRAPTLPELRAQNLSRGSLPEVLNDWVARLSSANIRVRASGLYGGRGFQEASAAAECLSASFVVASAGLGAVRGEDSVPSYGLSVANRTPDCVLSRITEAVSVSDWWREISSHSPLGRSLGEIIAFSEGVVIVALSQIYLSMVEGELANLPERHLARLRIITGAAHASVSDRLRGQLMPYDDRFDGPDSSNRGTRADFAQRAAHHFARNVVVHDPGGSTEAHQAAVRLALASWRLPRTFDRARHDDDTLLEVIQFHWDRADGQSSKLLRILRDELNIACEQGRFVMLMNKLRNERRVAA